MAPTIHICPYHPPLPRKGETTLSLFDLSKVFTKYLKLARFPFASASTLLGGFKQLPLSPDFLTQIATRDQSLKLFKAAFGAPQFFISQINFYQAWSEVSSLLGSKKNISGGQLSSKVSHLFFASLGSTLSVIKLAQLLEKFGKVDWAKVSPTLPITLVKTSNLMSLTFVGRGFLGSPTTAKALGVLLVSSGSLKLFFNLQTPSLLISLLSLISLTLNLAENLDGYHGMLGGAENTSRLSSVYSLRA
jgi:hypothetical protein